MARLVIAFVLVRLRFSMTCTLHTSTYILLRQNEPFSAVWRLRRLLQPEFVLMLGPSTPGDFLENWQYSQCGASPQFGYLTRFACTPSVRSLHLYPWPWLYRQWCYYLAGWTLAASASSPHKQVQNQGKTSVVELPGVILIIKWIR